MDDRQRRESAERTGSSVQSLNGRGPVRDGVSPLNDSESGTIEEDTRGSGDAQSEYTDKPPMTLVIPEACLEGWDCVHKKEVIKRESNPI
mgnify:CR=1 FL=1